MNSASGFWASLCSALALAASALPAYADGWPAVSPGDTIAPGQPTAGLFIVHAAPNNPTAGDWISANNNGGGNTYYSYFVEVPLSTTNLIVEIFDPDVRQGGTGEGSDTSLPHYDQQRGSETATATNYTLLNPASSVVQTVNGTAALPAASHATWFPFTTVAAPGNGHWEVRVDSLDFGANVSGYGLRARATVGGVATQLRVYADAHLSVQHYGASGLYVAHPYVTGHCQVRVRDHDADALTIGGLSTISLQSAVPSSVSQTFTGAALSANDALWAANDTNVGWHTDVAVLRPGIYTTEIAPRSTGATNEFQVGFYNPNGFADNVNPTVPAAGASWANSWRTYLPTPTSPATARGTAPVKPYLTQRVFHANDGSPNPPNVGQTGRYDVVVKMVNPTAYPITFSASNLVRSQVPGAPVLLAAAVAVTNGTVVSQPAINGSGPITWNPGTVAAGATVTMNYRVAVTPTAIGRIPVTGTPASFGTSAAYVDETANTTQARATYSWGPLCELAVTAGGSAVPTPASFASVKSSREGARLVVDLRTAVQVGVAYYELLELPAGAQDWVRIPGSATGAPEDHLEAKTVRVEALSRASRFMVRVVDVDGQSQLHGPFEVGATIGSDPAMRAIPWAQIGAEFEANRRSGRGSNPDPGAFDLSIERAGIARVRFEDLAAAGDAWQGVAVSGIGVYDRDHPVPIKLVSTDSTFGPGDWIEFVADPAASLYAKARVYQLRRDQTAAARITERQALPATAGQPVLTVERQAALDADLVYSFSSPLPDPWYFDRLVSTSSAPLTRQYTLVLDASQVGAVHLAGTFYGGIDHAGSAPDHVVGVSVNGSEITTLRFDGLDIAGLDTLIPAAALLSGANTVSLTLPAETYGIDIINVDRIALRYQGSIPVSAGAARFTPVLGDYTELPTPDALFTAGFSDNEALADSCAGVNAQNRCASAKVNGLDGATARIYRRLQDGSVEALLGAQLTAQGIAWAEPLTLGREIHVADATGLVAVQVSVSEGPAEITGPAELLIIAHPQFVDAIEPLAARRRAQGLSVQTLSTAAAYALYSGGNVDPNAIDRLIASAAAQNGTRNILLVGADTYDYHNRLGLGSISFVPSHYVRLHPVVNHAPSDGLYADLNGDQIPDLAIGRLPVRTLRELQAVLAKIDSYEAVGGPPVTPALFIADDVDPSGASFRDFSEALRGHLSSTSETAYLDDLPALEVRERLFRAARSGVDLIHYLGHSSPTTWSFPAPGLITPAELFAGVLADAVRPTIVIQWGCWNSYLAAPQTDTIGHAWLLGAGGAAAVIGATSLTDAEHDAFLSWRLIEEWDVPGASLGGAILAAKRNLALGDPGAIDVLLGTTLFGDPSMRRRP